MSGTDKAAKVRRLLAEIEDREIALGVEHEELLVTQHQSAVTLERYRVLFDAVPVPVLVVDRQGLAVDCNRLAQQWLGIEERPAQPSDRLLRAFDRRARAHLLRMLDQVAVDAGSASKNLILSLANGATCHAEVQVQMLSVSGPVAYRLVTLIDRTSSHERERERGLFYALLDSTDDLMVATDTNEVILLANRALLGLYDRSLEQVVGHPRNELMSLRDSMTHSQIDRQVLEGGLATEIEETLHAVDGAPSRIYSTHKFPLHDSAGRLLGVGAVSRDVTDDYERRKLQQLSEIVFNQGSDSIVITGADHRILRVNPAFERLSGFQLDSVRGHTLAVLSRGLRTDEFYEQIWRKMDESGRWSGEMTLNNSHGGLYTVWVSVSALTDERSRSMGYMLLMSDLTALRQAQAEVDHLAHYDTLTGLPNRALVMDRLGQLLSSARRRNRSFAIVFADLDRFKEVNDNLGHHVGDELLQVIARRLVASIRGQDTVGRIGGDEFVILLPEVDHSAALAVSRKIETALREPVDLSGVAGYRPQASMGVAVYPRDGESADVLMRNADAAMYSAKSSGRNQTQVYTAQMGEESARNFDVLTAFDDALAMNEFKVYLQPKFNMEDLSPIGAEALVRWDRPGRGLLLPATFLPVLERSGLLTRLDQWMLERVVELVGRWRAMGMFPPGWRISVNQSSIDIRKPNWIEHIDAVIERTTTPFDFLEVELTESVLSQPTVQVLENLAGLDRRGIRLSVDDFGTGYSNMSYLRSMPINVIKIDQSFVRDMVDDRNDYSLVRAIVTLAHGLGHATVAEGVESEAQRAALFELGCKTGQGNLLSAALSVEDFEQRYLTAN